MFGQRRPRARFWIESVLAALTCLLAIFTLISREWVEIVFRVDPDHSSGSFEWALIGGLFVLTLTFALVARTEWRRPITS